MTTTSQTIRGRKASLTATRNEQAGVVEFVVALKVLPSLPINSGEQAIRDHVYPFYAVLEGQRGTNSDQWDFANRFFEMFDLR